MKELPKIIIASIVVGVIIVVGIFMFSSMQSGMFSNAVNSNSGDILTETTATLSPVELGITSISSQSYNNTWINLNGIDGYILLEESEAVSLTFWYNSSTSGTWQFVANISGTTYVNDTLNTPDEYPIYYNGTHYFIGKTNSTNFWEGSIDEFRIYSGLLNSTQVNSIYSEGR